jgi:hypothetical protein
MVGLSSAVADWKQAQYPLEQWAWDNYHSRQIRYWFNESYYANMVYDSINAYAARFKHEQGLYKYIRGIKNPVARQVQIYRDKIYPGAINLETLTTGAIPLVADDPIIDAMRQLLIWSNWNAEKALYVTNGAKFGDSFIKVIDDRVRRQVRLEVLQPQYVKHLLKDEAGNIKEIHIEYERVDNEQMMIRPNSVPFNDQNTYTYTEVITAERFTTYKNGSEFAFYELPSGELVSSWDNIYGFVPVTHALHSSEGFLYGAAPFNASKAKIDEINHLASILHDQISKVINPIWYLAGVGKNDNLAVDTTREQVTTLHGPADSQPHPLVANINIADSAQVIADEIAELEKDMPELSLHKVKEAKNTSGVAIRNMFDDAASRIEGVMGNYDDPLIRASQMAMSMGAIGRYNNFTQFNERSYERGDLGFYLKPRPIFNDELSKRERIDLLMQSSAPQRAIWRELNISEDEIGEWEAEKAEQEAEREQQIANTITRMGQETELITNGNGNGAGNGTRAA